MLSKFSLFSKLALTLAISGILINTSANAQPAPTDEATPVMTTEASLVTAPSLVAKF